MGQGVWRTPGEEAGTLNKLSKAHMGSQRLKRKEQDLCVYVMALSLVFFLGGKTPNSVSGYVSDSSAYLLDSFPTILLTSSASIEGRLCYVAVPYFVVFVCYFLEGLFILKGKQMGSRYSGRK